MRERSASARGARGLVTLVVALTLGIVLYGRRPAPPGARRVPEVQRISLVEKDRSWNVVPLSRGGAAGSVWYRTRGGAFSFQLRAAGLIPGARYVIELSVDSTNYAMACRTADANGELAVDTALTELAGAACAGPTGAAPMAVRGAHDVEFRVKRAPAPTPALGEPALGPSRASNPSRDRDDLYVLRGDAVAHFVGTSR